MFNLHSIKYLLSVQKINKITRKINDKIKQLKLDASYGF